MNSFCWKSRVRYYICNSNKAYDLIFHSAVMCVQLEQCFWCCLNLWIVEKTKCKFRYNIKRVGKFFSSKMLSRNWYYRKARAKIKSLNLHSEKRELSKKNLDSFILSDKMVEASIWYCIFLNNDLHFKGITSKTERFLLMDSQDSC